MDTKRGRFSKKHIECALDVRVSVVYVNLP